MWKTWAPLRVKIFLWLAFRRRHWTADCRARHGLDAREQCYLCDQATETIDHIIACCPYTREVWHHICQALGRQLPPATPTIHTFWRRLRSLWTGQQQQGLDTFFALVSWTIWKEKNARCFQDAYTTVSQLMPVIKAETDTWIQAGAHGLEYLATRAMLFSCHGCHLQDVAF